MKLCPARRVSTNSLSLPLHVRSIHPQSAPRRGGGCTTATGAFTTAHRIHIPAAVARTKKEYSLFGSKVESITNV